MNIPEPVFTPVEINTNDNAVIIESCIKQNREDEKRVRAERHASRLRHFAMIAIQQRLDCYAIASLLESEAIVPVNIPVNIWEPILPVFLSHLVYLPELIWINRHYRNLAI
ncbi:DUF2732 domain-containing protein [Xenorhabdus bovienii]|uniref:DUF2732 family protein n=1 Tax=Xenorhabdus bovienii TaxID=40576 RepID=UPI0023B26B5D|nr:DUF2732 family protein [Xenorhabdus bovienii]MDE9447965.1 DUF2732 domain-containing protein [Xenorhabdus bovienii]